MLTTITDSSPANIFDVSQTLFYRRAYSMQRIQETTTGFYLGEYKEKKLQLSNSLQLMSFILGQRDTENMDKAENNEDGSGQAKQDYTVQMIEEMFSKSCISQIRVAWVRPNF